MSTLKVNKIESTTSGGDCIVNATNKPGHNLIINGAMQIAQKATSATNHGLTTVDRISPYVTNTNSGTTTFSQADITSGGAYDAGFRKSFKVATAQAGNTSTASAYMSAYSTKLEAQDIANSGWKYVDPNSKVTVSFWIKASTADNFQLQLVTDDGTKKKYNTTVAATTSWTRITKTIPGHADLTFNNDTGKGLTVQLIVATGSDMAGTVTQDAWGANTNPAVNANQINTWLAAGAGSVETTGWLLEVGDVANDYPHVSYGEELIRCKRYLNVLANPASETYSDDKGRQTIAWGQVNNVSSKYVYFSDIFDVPMRAAPSVYKVVGTSYFRIMIVGGANTTSDFDVQGTWTNCWEVRCTAVDSFAADDRGNAVKLVCFNSAARFGFSAEL